MNASLDMCLASETCGIDTMVAIYKIVFSFVMNYNRMFRIMDFPLAFDFLFKNIFTDMSLPGNYALD